MKLSLESFNFNVIFIILIVFKSLGEMKTNWKETGSLKKDLDSFVKSLILAFRDFFKSKFCGILVHIMSTFCSSKSNNENKCVLRNLFCSPKQRSFIWDILRSLISYDQVNSLSCNIFKVKALCFCVCVGRKQNARMKGMWLIQDAQLSMAIFSLQWNRTSVLLHMKHNICHHKAHIYVFAFKSLRPQHVLHNCGVTYSKSN